MKRAIILNQNYKNKSNKALYYKEFNKSGNPFTMREACYRNSSAQQKRNVPAKLGTSGPLGL
jgi:hypothetical protein